MEKTEELRYAEELVKAVKEDFCRRQEERRSLEQQWKLNLNYLAGNQYCEISPCGSIREEEKYYYWQSRSVYNHIAPIIDTRIAKLAKVRPVMSVRAAGGEDCDLKTAKTATEILNSTYARLSLEKIISRVTNWSETTGTGFYKIIWDSESGKKIGEKDDFPVYEGDVKITAISPFEIFPENLFTEEITEQRSIIHARAVSSDEIERIYGVKIQGEDIDVFSLSGASLKENGGYNAKPVSSAIHDSVLVIEKYERPNKLYPKGRVIMVAGDKLISVSELPYENGIEGRREFPFVAQKSISVTGCFFGASVIERIIPLQRAYNAVKNRKHEFINRISMGVLAVEDGSVDADELADEGLSPGKILVYRQGSRVPQMMNYGSLPIEFTYEEERLAKEFITVSGTSEVSRTSQMPSSATSGAALELLIEQDDTRLSATAEYIRNAVKETAKHIIRLFKQFATDTRIMRTVGTDKKVETFYFNSSDISSDDVVFDTENELSFSPAQKKTSVYEMLSSGLLTNEDGKIDSGTKSKILEILGYGSLDNAQDLVALHRGKAEKENIEMNKKSVKVNFYDEHKIHIDEHTRYLLTAEASGEKEEALINRIGEHIKEHKREIVLSETAVSPVSENNKL